jgi:S-adenosylmethionine synthetase
MPYLRPDAKAQFTVEFSSHHHPVRVHSIVLSTQHDEFDTEEAMHSKIESDVRQILIPRLIKSLHERTASLFKGDWILHVNPTGKFVIGGPAGDTGLTGRKIIVDTYGGRGAHGGGAFSGKDSSKVDRSAAYAARHIAKNLVAAGVCDECLVQLAYAIGVAEPVSVFIETYGSAHVEGGDAYIASKVRELFDLRPAAIVRSFGLKNPIFGPTAAYGHVGRKPYKAVVTVQGKEREVQFFGWELLDKVDSIKEAFGL